MKKYTIISLSAVIMFGAMSLYAMDRYNGFVHCPKVDRNLSYGDTDAKTNGAVSELHMFLDSYHGRGGAEGILLGAGKYGPKTAAEIKAFQKENGLEGLGMVGPKTRALIQKKCNAGN